MRRRAKCQDRAAQTLQSAQFAADVQYYLSQCPRQLPSRYLYDALGSALFEAICRLPWYPITRAEESLLARHGATLLRQVAPVSRIVELGPGSGEKLNLLIQQRDDRTTPLHVHLVDVSWSALDASARALGSAEDIRITTHQASYEDGLLEIYDSLTDDGRTLVLFFGS